jgi:hypothetical protein
MTKITSGHTLVTNGTLNAPQYLAVEAGGALKAANGATNNYEIIIHGSTHAGAAGGYGGVLGTATVINGPDGTVAVLGGGGYGTNPNGEGGSLAIYGTLFNFGVLETFQDAYVGGPAQISIASTGYLINHKLLSLTGASGTKHLPFATIGGSTLDVAGVLLNEDMLSVYGGRLGLGYGGNGAKVVVNGPGPADLTNLGTIAIHGASPLETLGLPYAGAGGSVTISNGMLINDDQINIYAATNTASLYGGAGGVLLTNENASVFNAGTITVGGQTTGPGLSAPAGTLSISGLSFYNTGMIDVRGASVASGEGGVLNVSGNLDLNGEVYIHAGANGGVGGAAYFGGTVLIGGTAPGTLEIGSSRSATGYYSGSVTILGDTSLLQSGTIDLSGKYSGVTIASTGKLFESNGLIQGTGYYNTIVNNGYFGVVNTHDESRSDLVNNGLFVLNGGSFGAFTGSGTGTFDITGGGKLFVLNLNQSTVQFAATPGEKETIVIEDMGISNFTLAGISDSSVLGIDTNDVTGVSTSGDTLTISTAIPGVSYHVNLSAPLPAGTQFTINYSDPTTFIGFVLPGGAVPAGQGPGSDHGLGRAFGADPASLFDGHLSAS